MDTATFLNHLRGALHESWPEAGVAPQTWSEYSSYIFKQLAEGAVSAGMEPRWHSAGRELLFDMVWLPRNHGAYRLPQVVIEHENGASEDNFIYDMRKLMMAWVPLRVMIGYMPRGHDPKERIETLRLAAEQGHWSYPDDCADLALVGPYKMDTPRDYLVLHRSAGSQTFVELGMLDSVTLPGVPQSPRQLLDAALAWLLAADHRPAPRYERDVVSQVQQYIERTIQRGSLPYRVYSEHRLHRCPGADPASYQVDLVILRTEDVTTRPALAVEFKFSPAPERFPPAVRQTKFPVLSLKEVLADIDKVAIYAGEGLADQSMAVVLDEGNTFRPTSGQALIDAAHRYGVLATWEDYVRVPSCAVFVVGMSSKG